MTYRDKFSASEHKAHYQNIATKVLREMTMLRSSVETSPNTPRRWVWELLQNAKDVHRGEGVTIKITEHRADGNEYLIFQHDGLPFTADNIRFLIEQISSKERQKNAEGKRKETGKFGTGFLTTHMLAEKVKVTGIAKEEGLDYRKFRFILDRSGFELHDIITAVEKSKKQVEDLDDAPPFIDYDEEALNTSFTYLLADTVSRKVRNQGLADLAINLPYTLCFVEDIISVTLEPSGITYSVTSSKKLDNSDLRIVTIKIKEKGKLPERLKFAILSTGLTTICTPVEIENNVTTLIRIASNVPKLFCDFPLIGTEGFPFPTVINNPNFNPTDPRDGIFLTDSSRSNPLTDENKQFIIEAVLLYTDLLDYAIENKWQNLHRLARLGTLKEPIKAYTSEEWYNEIVQKPIRKKLETSNIVSTADGGLSPIIDTDGKKYIWFPAGGSKDIREAIWNLGKLWFPHLIPKNQHIEFWNQTIWSECGKLTLLQFSKFIAQTVTADKLQECLPETDALAWLNMFYELLSLDEKEKVAIMDAIEIVPDQKGTLVKKGHLGVQLDEIPELYKDILELFGDDIRTKLVHEDIILDFEDHDQYSQADAIKAINAEVTEKTVDRDVAQTYRPALNMLLRYFSENPVEAKSRFPAIYAKKHLLYDDEEIMENINRAEELKDLLSVFQVSTADELRRKFENLSNDKPSLLPITEEILVAMGITNLEEWEDAMKDADLDALFDHRSVPTKEMFVLAHNHIGRARNNVITHLKSLAPIYNLDDLDINTAPTILAGVYKNDQPVKIVFRPAYSREVIVYYGAEKDALDYADAELWVDDGDEVWQVSLGHILKKNNIKKFPI